MYDTEFEPGEPGQGIAVPPHRAAAPTNKERRRATTLTMLDENLEELRSKEKNKTQSPIGQAYPVRWLENRYGLSGNYAAVVADELGWGRML